MKSFEAYFGGPPDVVESAPGRVNILGEHTDYNQGLVLPTAIPQRTHVAIRRATGPVSTLYAANLDQSSHFQNRPPQEQFARYVYGCLAELKHHATAIPALDIHVRSEIPMGVGLSSSAALEIATLRALRRLLDLELDDVVLAQIAQRAEIVHAGVNCGILDQMACSLLAPGSMLYLDTRSMVRELLPFPIASELLVIDSGKPRSLAASKYNERRAECEEAARLLGHPSLRDVEDPRAVEALPEPWRRRARHVVSENRRVALARNADASTLGGLMNASHASLRDDYEVSIPSLDRLIELLQSDANIYGAKLTGAGFGGACVALARPGHTRASAERVLKRYSAAGHSGRLLIPPGAA